VPKFEVQITESRDLLYEVEAETADEAAEIAKDMESDEAVRDTFRERQIDWTMPVKRHHQRRPAGSGRAQDRNGRQALGTEVRTQAQEL
jgi:hypothetical protein